jgi:hypothetical protein
MSLTPHTKKFSESENHMRKKNLKIHAVSLKPPVRCMMCHCMQNMKPHAQWTKHSCGPGWQPVKALYIKSIYLYKIYKFKGLSKKIISCMRCHFHRMKENCRFKNRIFRETEAEFKKAHESEAQRESFDVKPKIENHVALFL